MIFAELSKGSRTAEPVTSRITESDLYLNRILALILGRADSRFARRFTPPDCAETVPKPVVFEWLGLASSEKQIPQVVVIVRNQKSGKEHLEAVDRKSVV